MVFEPRDLDFWIPLALLSVSTKFRADPTRFDLFYEGFSAALVVDKNDRGRRFLVYIKKPMYFQCPTRKAHGGSLKPCAIKNRCF